MNLVGFFTSGMLEYEIMSVKTDNRLKAVRKKIKTFPNTCGLYFMKGRNDKVLYIGKAKNLRSRVASYFQPGADLAASRGPKITEMLGKVMTIDFLETAGEVDATLQEARLIKDIHPPYNTDLADDKTFPYLEITAGRDFPAVYMTRRPGAKKQALWPLCQCKGFAGGCSSSAENLQIPHLQTGYLPIRPQAQVLQTLHFIQYKAVYGALRGQNRQERIPENYHRPD